MPSDFLFPPPEQRPLARRPSLGSEGAPVQFSFHPPLPFQYPSLGHLDAAIGEQLTRIQRVEGRAAGTARWMRTSYRRFRRFVHEHRQERALLGGDMARQVAVLGAWVGAMRDDGLTRVTINNHWRALRSLFQRLQCAEGKVNPLTLVAAPRPGKSLPRFLSRADATRLLAYARGADWGAPLLATRNLAVIGVMLLAGLRRSEVLALECADVTIEDGTLRIRHGKGRDGGKARTAYAPPQLQAILAAYLVERRAAQRLTAAFFVARTDDRAMGVRTLRAITARCARALGTAVTPHALRHTYATLLRQAGVPDRVAMDLLGHSSLQMLQRYSHVLDGEHQREAARLELDVAL